jgi:hypothetical protein
LFHDSRLWYAYVSISSLLLMHLLKILRYI